jgi:hypothetical protein
MMVGCCAVMVYLREKASTQPEVWQTGTALDSVPDFAFEHLTLVSV